MNKMIVGFLLGVSVSMSVGAFAARDSVDVLTYQHQIERLQAEQANRAILAGQMTRAYTPGYNTYYGYESTYPMSCNGLAGSGHVSDQWGRIIGVRCPNGQIQYFGVYSR